MESRYTTPSSDSQQHNASALQYEVDVEVAASDVYDRNKITRDPIARATSAASRSVVAVAGSFELGKQASASTDSVYQCARSSTGPTLMRQTLSGSLVTGSKHAARWNRCRTCLNAGPYRSQVAVIYQQAHVFSSSSRTAAPSLPKVAQPSIWQSIVPRALRERRKDPTSVKAQTSKDWNPATFFIIIFLLIGSQGIQMITLRNDYTTFSRKADAKIALLREVIQRVQNGEKVDVEGLLGTGDPAKEKEWEEVMREIEAEDILRPSKPKRRKGNSSNADRGKELDKAADPEPISDEQVALSEVGGNGGVQHDGDVLPKRGGPRGFY